MVGKALLSQPDNANAMSNLGFFLMLKGDFAGTIAKVERAHRASPNLLSPLVLSDAHRLSGNYAGALEWSGLAVKIVTNENLRDTRLVGGEWLYNHLPESRGDQETWKNGIYATTLERKEALAQFVFALDSALTGNTAAADKAWARAVELAPAADREFWQRFRAKLPPIPVRDIKGRTALAPAEFFAQKSNIENPELYPVFPFRLFAFNRPNADDKTDVVYGFHPVGNTGHDIGPSMTTWQPMQQTLTLQLQHMFSFEYFAYSPITEWGGRKLRIPIEDDAILMEQGVQFLHPANHRLLVIK